MNNQEKRKELERMLAKCPEILTPTKAVRWSPLGKNKVYELLKNGKLRSFKYRGGYIISKEDLIDYLLEHCEDTDGRTFKIGKVGDNYE